MLKKEYNKDGCFAVIAATIAHTFTGSDYSTKSNGEIGKCLLEVKLNFLKSKSVSLFCDCTNNFEQTKLINEFKRQKKFMIEQNLKKEMQKKGKIITAILLNRILQTAKSPARKTQDQLAKKLNCDVKTVARAELFICQKLIEKVSILEILINIK